MDKDAAECQSGAWLGSWFGQCLPLKVCINCQVLGTFVVGDAPLVSLSQVGKVSGAEPWQHHCARHNLLNWQSAAVSEVTFS